MAQADLFSFDPEKVIELRTADGATRIAGELIEVVDGFYVVRTEIGELRISVGSVSCDGAGCPVSEDSGSFTLNVAESIDMATVSGLLEAYAAQIGATIEAQTPAGQGQQSVRLTRPDGSAVLDISYGHGAFGLRSVLEGTADASLTDVAIADDLATAGTGAGPEALTLLQNQQVVARDGLVVAVHPKNPIRKLSQDDIRRIFSGEVTNWLELGGGNVPISVMALPQDHRRSTLFADYFLGDTSRLARSAAVFPRDQILHDALLRDVGSIGYLSRAIATKAKPVSLRQSCGLLSRPDAFSIKSGGYPLGYPVLAYGFPERLDRNAADFLAWLGGDDAHAPWRDEGFADTFLERGSLEDMGMMLVHTALSDVEFNQAQYGEMLTRLRDAQRLSLAFRFETGSSLLDAASFTELERLADSMDAGTFDGLEMLVVGFADSTGSGAINTNIALERAEVVRRVLTENIDAATASRLRIRTQSYGELFPLACNETETGRASNRRVEIWVRRLGVQSN